MADSPQGAEVGAFPARHGRCHSFPGANFKIHYTDTPSLCQGQSAAECRRRGYQSHSCGGGRRTWTWPRSPEWGRPWVFGVRCWATRQCGDAAKPRVWRDERVDLARVFQIEGCRQLKGVQSPKTFRRPIFHEQKPGSMEMPWLNGQGNQQTTLAQVGSEASPGGFDLPFVDLPCARFDGEDGLHLHYRQMRNKGSRGRVEDNPTHEFCPCFLVIDLRQRTRGDKVVWQLALLPLGDDGVRQGSGHSGESLFHLVP